MLRREANLTRSPSQSSSIDDAVTAAHAQMVGVPHFLLRQQLAVAQSPGFDALEETEDGQVGLRPVRDEQVRVPGRPHVAVGDDTEATDHYIREAGGVGVGDDAAEVRTRELARGHGRPSRRRPAGRTPAGKAAGRA